MRFACSWAASPATRSAALLVVLAASSMSLPASADQPTFTAETDTIQANGELVWNADLNIMNPLDVGFYLDSLYLDVEDLGPLEPGRARLTSTNISPLVRAADAISAQDGTTIQFSVPAACETAKLTFRLFAHDAKHHDFKFSVDVRALPGPFSASFPSESLLVQGKRVEYLLIPARMTAARAPAILIVHDHASSARRLLMQAMTLSARGYAVGLVSQPGYGASEGPADWCGPATLAALSTAFERMKHTGGVDSSRLAVWGIGRGATAAALLASRRTDVKALVAQSGVYDLAGASRGTSGAELRKQVLAEAGKDSSAWRARSPIYEVAHLGATTFVLHGEQDPIGPASQARAYVAMAKAAGRTADGQFFPAAGNPLPSGPSTRAILEFFKHQLNE